MNNILLPLILSLGYGLGGQALAGAGGAIAGAGLGLIGGSLINSKKRQLQYPFYPFQQGYELKKDNTMQSYLNNPTVLPRPANMENQQKQLNTIATLALLLAGLGGGLYLGDK